MAHELLQALHPLLSDRVRLSIMGVLAASREPVAFNTLLEELELTKGNLSTHLRRLEEGGFIDVKKSFVDRKPLSTYTASKTGRKEMQRYLETVESLLKRGFKQ